MVGRSGFRSTSHWSRVGQDTEYTEWRARLLRRDCHRREHAGLEMARDVAEEDISAGLRQVHCSRLSSARVKVVAIADEIDTGAVLDDVAVPIEWESRITDPALMVPGTATRHSL